MGKACMSTKDDYHLIRSLGSGRWRSILFGTYEECVLRKKDIASPHLKLSEMRIVATDDHRTGQVTPPIEQFGDGDYDY